MIGAICFFRPVLVEPAPRSSAGEPGVSIWSARLNEDVAMKN